MEQEAVCNNLHNTLASKYHHKNPFNFFLKAPFIENGTLIVVLVYYKIRKTLNIW